MKKRGGRFSMDVGDIVKFKIYKDPIDTRSTEFRKEGDFETFYGTVADISRKNSYIEVTVDEGDRRDTLPKGIPIKIETRQIIQHFPRNLVRNLTPRLALKHLWKDFTFREVKTVNIKNSKLLYVEYKYVSKSGLERSLKFNSYEEACDHIDSAYHHNIVPHYEDFFGFTTEVTIRNNDVYTDKEIFFSKKCYTELDWNDHCPTGDFHLYNRGFNSVPPRPETLICGIVENGEKGLFFKKWFCCSKEFLTLWTMICQPTDPSLYSSYLQDPSHCDWIPERATDNTGGRTLKDLESLLKEVDTSWYSPTREDVSSSNFAFHNVERTALFYKSRYKEVIETVFRHHLRDTEGENTKYEGREKHDGKEKEKHDGKEKEKGPTRFQRRLYKSLMQPRFVK